MNNLLDTDDWFSPRAISPTNELGTVPCTLVDGVADSLVAVWHKNADKDGDGEVTGAEARDFFFRTGLPRQILSKIWQYSIRGHNGGLGMPQFIVALRLVGCAQAGMELTDHLADLARLGPFQRNPLPSPKLEGWESADVLSPQSSGSMPPPPYAAVAQTAPASFQVPTLTNPPPYPRRSGTGDASSSAPSFPFSASSSALNECELKLKAPAKAPIRLPPLQKAAGDLCCLQGLRGSLFAGPGGSGGLLQYGDAEGDIAVPQEGYRSRTEDRDAAPCGEIPVPDGSTHPVTCIACDPDSGLLYSGHRDGFVVCWHFPGGNTRAAVERTARFQAHRYGCVSAMCASPASEMLWTGSSWGSLRVWPDLHASMRAFGAAGVNFNPTNVELKRVGAEGAHDDTQFMVLAGAGGPGSILWTAGVYALALWDGADGTYLGSLHEKNADGTDIAYAVRAEQGLEIDPRTQRPRSMVPPEELILEKAGQQLPPAPPPPLLFRSSSFSAYSSYPYAPSFQTGGYGALRGLGKLAKNITKVAANVTQNVTGQARVRAAEDLTADFGPTLANPLGVIRGLVLAADGTVWVGYRGSKAHGTGFLEVYTAQGKRKMLLKTTDGVTCVRSVGARIWAGLADGSVQVWDLSMSAIATFAAHEGPVKDIGVVGPRAFTLGVDNCIHCFDAFTPSARDQQLIRGVEPGLVACRGRAQIQLLAGTWNVAEKKCSVQGVYSWIGCRCKEADLVVVGFQEIEMGSSSVVLGAAKDLVASSLQERGNANAQGWASLVQQALSEGDPKAQWDRVALRQMSGILLLVYARAELTPFVGKVETCSVPCGVMGVGGNKGGVGVRLSLYRRSFAFVAAHFAAHQENVQKRNENYVTIVRNMNFSSRRQQQAEATVQAGGGTGSTTPPTQTARSVSGPGSAAPTPPLSHAPSSTELSDVASGFTDQFASLSLSQRFGRTSGTPPPGANGGETAALMTGDTSGHGTPAAVSKAADVAALQNLQDDAMGPVGTLNSSDVTVWVGDFNYRLDCSYEEAVECARRGKFESLRPLDQLYAEWRAGRVFQGLEEGPLSFCPTYKFDKGVPGLCYDSSEKRRVPAWTDRIFFRGSLPTAQADQVRVACREYNCVMDVLESDHKPVFALLALDVPYTRHDLLRAQVLGGLRQVQPAPIPAKSLVTVTPTALHLSNAHKGADAASISLTNHGPHHTVFRVTNPTSVGWIRVEPTSGIVPPGGSRLLDVRSLMPAGSKEDRVDLVIEDEFYALGGNSASFDRLQTSVVVGVGGAGAPTAGAYSRGPSPSPLAQHHRGGSSGTVPQPMKSAHQHMQLPDLLGDL